MELKDLSIQLEVAKEAARKSGNLLLKNKHKLNQKLADDFN